MMGSFSNLLQDEANILQEEMAMKNSAAKSPNPNHKIIFWWMLSFLTRSKARFQFC